jgi:hypothetical protein
MQKFLVKWVDNEGQIHVEEFEAEGFDIPAPNTVVFFRKKSSGPTLTLPGTEQSKPEADAIGYAQNFMFVKKVD